MRSGLKFSLKSLFDTFLIAILFSVLSEFVFLGISKFFNLEIFLTTEVFMSILISSFLTLIFSRKNIVNQLFINGLSRKKIAKIIYLSCIVYSLVYFMLFIVYEFLYAELATNIYELNTILHLIVVYFSIIFIIELATFFALLYKNISMKKGKGVNKTFYRYIYSFVIILFTYIYRFFYPNFYELYTDLVLAVIAILLCKFQFIFAFINNKWILNIDIRA